MNSNEKFRIFDSKWRIIVVVVIYKKIFIITKIILL